MKKRMFNCLFTQTGETYKLFVYDTIERDWYEKSETSASYFAEKLAEIPEGSTLEVHINSDGGDAFEGTAIYNQLKAAPLKKIGIVDGHAFSAATFILMAGDERVMNTGTTLLVHNAWTVAIGNADDLRSVADDLDKLMESNRSIFLERCSLSEEELIALMKENRMLSPKEALEFGFIDCISSEKAEDPEKDALEDDTDGADPGEGEPNEDDPEPEEETEDDPDEDAHALRPERIVAQRYFKQFF